MSDHIRFCNVPDSLTGVEHLGAGWPGGIVNYAITDLIDGVSEGDYLAAIAWSLAEWGKYGRITSKQVERAMDAQLLAMARRIDGPAGVLGETELYRPGLRHARMWMDSTDKWDVRWPDFDPKRIPLFLVTLHEVGHALGFGHAPEGSGAVMEPYLNIRFRGLQKWDQDKVVSVYGKAVVQPPAPPPLPPVPTPTPVPGGAVNKEVIRILVALLPFAKMLAARTATPVDDVLVSLLEQLLPALALTESKAEIAQVLRQHADQVEA